MLGNKPPLVLNLFITDACNLACQHCYVDSCPDLEQARYMKPAQLEFILKSMERENVELVHIFGGEPFLHPDIRDIVGMCTDFCGHVNIATNGTAIDQHIPWLAKDRASLSINLVGEDPRVNEIIGCDFPIHEIMANAKAAIHAGIPVNGIVCPFPVDTSPGKNASFYASYLHRMHEATGISDFFMLYFSRLGRGKRAWSRVDANFYRPEGWLSFLSALKASLEIEKEPFSVFCEPAFENNVFAMLPPPPVQCEMIVQANVVIKHDLTAYPCVLFLGMDDPQFSVKFDGSVDKLWAAFNDIQARAITRKANTCKHCSSMPYCGPCVPYIQDDLKDYRCRGNTGREILVGCPLATVRLY
ncbi:MAG: radical SAM protein [Candidatus Lokiarchaeota archaeon]|nr:radical SAM protein [Candidatus Lokiarchaeota archaeon]